MPPESLQEGLFTTKSDVWYVVKKPSLFLQPLLNKVLIIATLSIYMRSQTRAGIDVVSPLPLRIQSLETINVCDPLQGIRCDTVGDLDHGPPTLSSKDKP